MAVALRQLLGRNDVQRVEVMDIARLIHDRHAVPANQHEFRMGDCKLLPVCRADGKRPESAAQPGFQFPKVHGANLVQTIAIVKPANDWRRLVDLQSASAYLGGRKSRRAPSKSSNRPDSTKRHWSTSLSRTNSNCRRHETSNAPKTRPHRARQDLMNIKTVHSPGSLRVPPRAGSRAERRLRVLG